jgi:adenosylhomocysteine nucleosidase
LEGTAGGNQVSERHTPIADRTFFFVTFAVKEEAAAFLPHAKTAAHLRTWITGMGRDNAQNAAQAMLARTRPDWVITAGFAGGLDPRLSTGTVIYSAPAGSVVESKLEASGAQRARFHCAGRIAVTAGEKALLRQQTGADAVEMESSVIEEVCREWNIPSAIVRVVSDSAEEDLPLDFNQLLTPRFEIHFGKLARALFLAPGKIPGLIRLQRRTALAATKLAEVLVAITRP